MQRDKSKKTNLFKFSLRISPSIITIFLLSEYFFFKKVIKFLSFLNKNFLAKFKFCLTFSLLSNDLRPQFKDL